MTAPERIRVAQDTDGFWTCREAVSGSQEYVRADLVPARCSYCDGTGDVHRADGEWLGECDCGSEFRHAYDVEANPSKAFRVIQSLRAQALWTDDGSSFCPGCAPSPAAASEVTEDGDEERRIDALRLAAFRTNGEADRLAYFAACSKWFQDRHYRRIDALKGDRP